MKSLHYVLLFAVTAMLVMVLTAQPGLAQEAAVCESDVIVQEGDWLSTIAEQAYGDPTLYPAIAEATNLMAQTDSSYASIDSHDIIEPGWKLCLPAQAAPGAMAETAPVESGVLTVEALINATYSGIYEAPVTLTGGRYEGEPFVEGDASRPIVEYMNGSERFGDLNGDGVDDAVVFLVENSGGTGNFVYVAAQLNQGGLPLDAGAVWIEDRIQVISAAIENGQINLEITAAGPGDAACCKSHKTPASYALQDGFLAQLPTEEQPLQRISADDLNGTSWTLLEMNYEQPALAETAVSISFADGQVTGFAGCNNYNSSFTLGDDNPFAMTFTPIVATQEACPDPSLSQETAYFSALEKVSLWGYDIGRLAMSYVADPQSGPNRLLFAPAQLAATETEIAAEATAFTYQCDADKSFSVEFTDEGPDGSANLTLAGQTLTLPRVPSGSGAQYSDGQTTFWTQGDEGFIEVNGEITYENCVTQLN